MKTILTLLLTACVSLVANAQQDSTQHWEISLSAGVSQPISSYSATSGNAAGFAKTGFASNLRVNYLFTPQWSVWANYNVSTSKLNTNKLSAESVKTLDTQLSNYTKVGTIQNANTQASRWVLQNVTAGIGYTHQIKAKLSATYFLGSGVAIVSNPNVINTMYVNNLVFETRAKATNNAAWVMNGGVKIAYKVQERTSLFIGVEFFNISGRGAFEYTTVGADQYRVETVSYKQAIQIVNFNLGIITHF
ncbi:MAG: hypothetical protein H7331_11315 [Bacteroidia bacterium]|nr:hypothetical protein [Bacteroidia bacterium]